MKISLLFHGILNKDDCNGVSVVLGFSKTAVGSIGGGGSVFSSGGEVGFSAGVDSPVIGVEAETLVGSISCGFDKQLENKRMNGNKSRDSGFKVFSLSMAGFCLTFIHYYACGTGLFHL